MGRKIQIQSLIHPTEDSRQYIVYDTGIVDINERKQKAVVYQSAVKLARAIGIQRNKIPVYVNPKDQKRFISKKDGKQYAIRAYKQATA